MSWRWERHDWVPYVELPDSANEDDSWDLQLKLANEAQDIIERVDEALPDIDDLPHGAEREALLEAVLKDALAANDRAIKSLVIAASVAAKLSASAKARPVGPSATTLAREMFLREICAAKETAFQGELGIAKRFGNLDDGLKDIAADFCDDLRERRAYEVVELSGGGYCVKSPSKVLADWLRDHYDDSEYYTLIRKKPDILRLASADGDLRLTRWTAKGKAVKGLLMPHGWYPRNMGSEFPYTPNHA